MRPIYFTPHVTLCVQLQTALIPCNYRGADKSLAQTGRKQAVKHVRDARDFNNTETRAVIKYIWLNQLSNTTNLWWIVVYYLVINYMFQCLWPSNNSIYYN